VPDAGLSAGEAARRIGVATTTLRTWDRRYGLGPSHREPGRHRRYDEHDLIRLELMRRLTVDGVAPAEAARLRLVQRSRSARNRRCQSAPGAFAGRPSLLIPLKWTACSACR